MATRKQTNLGDLPQQRGAKQVHRFAHPFFTNVPIRNRPEIPGAGKRAMDFSSRHVLAIPLPPPAKPMTLEDIVGRIPAKEIKDSSAMIFHAVGDTGNEDNGAMQELVAESMTQD